MVGEVYGVGVEILEYAWRTGLHMGRYLLLGIVLAAALGSIIPLVRLRRAVTGAGVWPVLLAAVAAVTTPLCSCGTVSLLIPLLAAGVPWGPIFAWLIASPIISPTGFVLIGGTLGWDMSVTKVMTGLVLGVGGGLFVNGLQARGWLDGQSRVPLMAGEESFCCEDASASTASGCSCGVPAEVLPESCCSESGSSFTPADAEASCCGADPPAEKEESFAGLLVSSLRSLVPIYVAFLLVAGTVGILMPSEWIVGLFGADRAWAVPTAALLGTPLYTSVASAVPLTLTFTELGMSRAAALAFLLTGPGMSLPALGAVFTVARARVIGLYVGLLLSGSIIMAYLFGVLLR